MGGSSGCLAAAASPGSQTQRETSMGFRPTESADGWKEGRGASDHASVNNQLMAGAWLAGWGWQWGMCAGWLLGVGTEVQCLR